MKCPNPDFRRAAIAAAVSLPLATGAAWAQESQGTDQSSGSSQQSQDSTGQQSSQAAGGSASGSSGSQADNVVATVGGAEIRGSDVLAVVGMLPPQLQSQPPQMLIPMALDQLILRELILEQARAQNLAADPEVQALVASSAQSAEDNAVVQVWLDREMASIVTDEAVQQAYDDAQTQAQAQGQPDLPPIAEVRPQIEQFLRQQAVQDLRTQLREGADIVLFDATGNPIDEQNQSTQGGGAASSGTSSDASSNGSTDGSGSSAQDQTSGEASGEQSSGN